MNTLMQTGKETHVLLHQGWVSCMMTLPDRHLAPADQLRGMEQCVDTDKTTGAVSYNPTIEWI